MKKFTSFAAILIIAIASCGDMDNNVNEEHSRADSIFSSEEGYDNPNTSTVPLRDSFGTDHNSPTAGPDNAVPKSSAQDSTQSIREHQHAH